VGLDFRGYAIQQRVEAHLHRSWRANFIDAQSRLSTDNAKPITNRPIVSFDADATLSLLARCPL
jgi:hypothetical protein